MPARERVASLLGVKILRSERAIFYWELLLSVLFLWFSFSVTDNFRSVNFHTFMRRDLDRALELLKGHLIFFGPEASGGGYLPGPFFYYLLAGALVLSPIWSSAFVLLLNLFYVTALGGWLWMKRQYNIVMALLLLALLSFSHPIRGFVALFLNVSYQLPFGFFALLFSCRAFSAPDASRRDRYLLGAALLIGLGMQLHFSIVCLMWAILFLWVLAPRLNLVRPSLRAGSWACLIVFLTCLPYAIWRLAQAQGMEFGQSGSYVGQAPGSLRTLFMLANFAGQIPLGVTLREAALRLFAITPLPLLAALVAVICRQVKPEPSVERTRNFHALLWIALWSFFPFSYVFLVHLGRRYGMIYCFCLILITLELQFRILRSKRATWLMTCVMLAMMILGIWTYLKLTHNIFFEAWWQVSLAFLAIPVVYHGLLKHYRHTFAVGLNVAVTITLLLVQYELGSPHGLREKQVPRLHHVDWQRVWREVYGTTGWSYEESIRRLYFVNLRLDEDPKPVYEDTVREFANIELGPRTGIPSGYFVVNAKYLRQRRRHAVFHDFLLQQHIPPIIKESLENGNIELGTPLTRGMVVIPYYVRAGRGLPPYFHDVGEGYQRGPEARDLDQIREREGTLALKKNQFLFKWNECADQNPFCNTGALIEIQAQSNSTRLKIVAKIIGSALSQNSPWVSPSWTQGWIEPFVEVRCGQKTHHELLFPLIGYSRAYGSNEFNELLQSNNSVIAPFTREFEVECPEPVREVAVGRAGSVIEQLTTTMTLPPAKLSRALSPDETNVYK